MEETYEYITNAVLNQGDRAYQQMRFNIVYGDLRKFDVDPKWYEVVKPLFSYL